MTPILLVLNGFILLNAICSPVVGETGCPDPEDIAPCRCRDEPSTVLVCSNINDSEELSNALENSRRYTYQEVHLESSVVRNMPEDTFVEIGVKELYLNDVILQNLFHSPPKGLETLYKIQMDKTTFLSTLDWRQLKPLKNLRELSFNMAIKIPKGLSENLPNNLRQLTFNGATIKKLFPGTFKQLVNLDKLAIDSSKLEDITRDAFPRLFNVRILSFNNNKLTKIPEDLFTDMPNLQFLSLKNNQISQIPESAFRGRKQNIPFMKLDGNPLICDCNLKWIVNDKPEIIGGTCADPEALSGRDLIDVYPSHIKCSYF